MVGWPFRHRSAAFRLQKLGITLRRQQVSTPCSSFTFLQP
jgi:hypothetical protein